MKKAYKFRLYPTKQQEKTLFWTLTRCRELYNAALAERKEAYRMAGKSITYYEQKRDLPEIKAELQEEYQQIHSQVLQDAAPCAKKTSGRGGIPARVEQNSIGTRMPPSTFYGLEEPNAGQPA